MTDTITKSEGQWSEGPKRFFAPFILETSCPNCGNRFKKDLSKSCLSYPSFDDSNRLNFYCAYGECGFEGEGCGHKWAVKLKINISFEIES